MEIKLQQKTTIQLIMTPQLQQAIKLLQLSRVELIEEVHRELQENPVLADEDHEPRPRDAGEGQQANFQTDDSYSTPAEREPERTSRSDQKKTQEIDWEQLLENRTLQQPTYASRGGFEELPPIEQSLTRAASLQEHLRWQLQMSDFTDDERRFAEYVISSLDENGLLDLRASYRESLEELEEATRKNPTSKYAVFNQGVFHEKMGEAEEARSCMLRFLGDDLSAAEREAGQAALSLFKRCRDNVELSLRICEGVSLLREHMPQRMRGRQKDREREREGTEERRERARERDKEPQLTLRDVQDVVRLEVERLDEELEAIKAMCDVVAEGVEGRRDERSKPAVIGMHRGARGPEDLRGTVAQFTVDVAAIDVDKRGGDESQAAAIIRRHIESLPLATRILEAHRDIPSSQKRARRDVVEERRPRTHNEAVCHHLHEFFSPLRERALAERARLDALEKDLEACHRIAIPDGSPLRRRPFEFAVQQARAARFDLAVEALDRYLATDIEPHERTRVLEYIERLRSLERRNNDGSDTELTIEHLAERADLDPDDAEEVLKLIQQFDPVGVASRDLRECLKVQAEYFNFDDLELEIIDRHLHNLEKHNYQAIARDLKVPLEDVHRAAKEIQKLESRPARNFTDTDEKSIAITPDVYVVKGERARLVADGVGVHPLGSDRLELSSALHIHAQDQKARDLVNILQPGRRVVLGAAGAEHDLIVDEVSPGHRLIFRAKAPLPHISGYDDVAWRVYEDWMVLDNDRGVQRLYINESLTKRLLQDPNAKDFVGDKLKSAQWLIRAIEQRRKTIIRVTEAIVERQKDFFERGVAHLRPMILRDIAEAVGMHESTISRVTTNKYVHTPQGIFELKYFFNSSIKRVAEEDIASESVKQAIKRLIDNEDKSNPLSDQTIVKLLEEKEGIQIARRTVAKYREMMKILASNLRKEIH